MLKWPVWIGCFLLLLSCGREGRLEPSQSIFIDDLWRFMPGDHPLYGEKSYDDSGWELIYSDRPWEEQGFAEYDGFAWYRRTLQLPEFMRRKSKTEGGLLLSLGVVHDADAVFVNGVQVASSGGFPPSFQREDSPRVYFVKDSYWRFGEENTIAVRVYNASGDGGIVAKSIDLRSISVLDQVTISGIVPSHSGIFTGLDSVRIEVSLMNQSSRVARVNLVVQYETVRGEGVESEKVALVIYPSKQVLHLSRFLPSSPGFYRCRLFLEKDGQQGRVHQFVVGFDPERIVSAPDRDSDFSSFWDQARQELSSVGIQWTPVIRPAWTGAYHEMYRFELPSMGSVVKGFYALPRGNREALPVLFVLPEDTVERMPLQEMGKDFAYVTMTLRKKSSLFPDSLSEHPFLQGLGNRDTYYLREVYLDMLRVLDYVFSRPDTDTLRVGVMGEGFGGSLALALASLDSRVRAVSADRLIFSDFRTALDQNRPPAGLLKDFMERNPEIGREQVLRTLSYFDVKNMVQNIQSPVLLGVALQDTVFLPEIGFSVYTQIPSSKAYRIFPAHSGKLPETYHKEREMWFRNDLNLP